MYSDAQQDEFAIRINEWKKNGYYIDIGSCGGYASNNTAMLDKLGWSGICIEINKDYLSSYHGRTCVFVNSDALKLDYKSLFESQEVPETIDYLSLDIDQSSVDALKILPHDKYRFKCITIEHDGYLYGDQYRKEQRRVLYDLGYHLLCANVYVQQNGWTKPDCAFEDWWVEPDLVNIERLKKIQCENKYPLDIISSLDNLYNRRLIL